MVYFWRIELAFKSYIVALGPEAILCKYMDPKP